MTDAEKMAASRVGPEAEAALARHAANGEVARVIGWTELETLNTGQVAGIPPGGGYWQGIPDIFANTEAGAWAREQAAGWLLAQGIGDMGVWHSSSLAFYFDEPTWFVKIGPAPRCSGKTIGEATAAAIHAAVVALGAGEGKKP